MLGVQELFTKTISGNSFEKLTFPRKTLSFSWKDSEETFQTLPGRIWRIFHGRLKNCQQNSTKIFAWKSFLKITFP